MNNPLESAYRRFVVLHRGMRSESAYCLGLRHTNVNNVNDCYFLDTSTIGGMKFEDYNVTNPAAALFDSTLRLKELAALGSSTAATLCQAQSQTPFTDPAPSITCNW
jgi:hypothetical protein